MLAAGLDASAATLLRRIALNADAGWPTEASYNAAGLRSLAAAGLATPLGQGTYWPGSYAPDASARLAQSLLDALQRILIEGLAVPDCEGWVHIAWNQVGAALHRADCGAVHLQGPLLDVLLKQLEDDGWIEWRDEDCWRITVRTLTGFGRASDFRRSGCGVPLLIRQPPGPNTSRLPESLPYLVTAPGYCRKRRTGCTWEQQEPPCRNQNRADIGLQPRECPVCQAHDTFFHGNSAS